MSAARRRTATGRGTPRWVRTRTARCPLPPDYGEDAPPARERHVVLGGIKASLSSLL